MKIDFSKIKGKNLLILVFLLVFLVNFTACQKKIDSSDYLIENYDEFYEGDIDYIVDLETVGKKNINIPLRLYFENGGDNIKILGEFFEEFTFHAGFSVKINAQISGERNFFVKWDSETKDVSGSKTSEKGEADFEILEFEKNDDNITVKVESLLNEEIIYLNLKAPTNF